MNFEIERARVMLQIASAGLPWLAGDGSRLMAATLVAIQHRLLKKIEKMNFDVFAREIELTHSERFRCLPHAWRLARVTTASIP